MASPGSPLVTCASSPPPPRPPPAPGRQGDDQAAHIEIIATGGTIAGAQASKTEYGYKSGTFKVEDLINAVPQMKELAGSPASRSPTSAART